nr:MAG TPA: Photosystem II reaction centre I protein (PSII 4.8 kDa protein) [Bacteriophage sp.]
MCVIILHKFSLLYVRYFVYYYILFFISMCVIIISSNTGRTKT